MICHVKETRPSLPVSVEVEKVGRGLEALVPLADVVFVSKEVAKANGANDMNEVRVSDVVRDSIVVQRDYITYAVFLYEHVQ